MFSRIGHDHAGTAAAFGHQGNVVALNVGDYAVVFLPLPDAGRHDRVVAVAGRNFLLAAVFDNLNAALVLDNQGVVQVLAVKVRRRARGPHAQVGLRVFGAVFFVLQQNGQAVESGHGPGDFLGRAVHAVNLVRLKAQGFPIRDFLAQVRGNLHASKVAALDVQIAVGVKPAHGFHVKSQVFQGFLLSCQLKLAHVGFRGPVRIGGHHAAGHALAVDFHAGVDIFAVNEASPHRVVFLAVCGHMA